MAVPRGQLMDQAAKAAGFLVCSNTTIYKETDLNEIGRSLFLPGYLGVDGFCFPGVWIFRRQTRISCRARISAKSFEAGALLDNTLDGFSYLSGIFEGRTRTGMHGWELRRLTPRAGRPVLRHYRQSLQIYREMVDTTPWEKYGRGNDPRCADCMMHVGFETTPVLGANAIWAIPGKC